MKVVSKISGISFLMAFAGILLGCSDKPKGTLSEKEMVRLMADMQLAEAYSDMEYMGSDSQERREQLAKSVLAEHDVTQEELDSTLSWYGRNLDDYTELFKKVDKEIVARRKKIMKTDSRDEVSEQADMLWPYAKNGTLSSLGTSDGWIISVDEPGLTKGDMVEWKMHLDKVVSITGVLGVDYTDGTSEAVTNVISGRPAVELRLQTDTSKNVRRLYGTLRLKDKDRMPLFADSISLRRLPFDSLEFRKYRNQKKYGIPARKMPKIEEKKDSVGDTRIGGPDSIASTSVAGKTPIRLRDTEPVAGPAKPLKPLKPGVNGRRPVLKPSEATLQTNKRK